MHDVIASQPSHQVTWGGMRKAAEAITFPSSPELSHIPGRRLDSRQLIETAQQFSRSHSEQEGREEVADALRDYQEHMSPEIVLNNLPSASFLRWIHGNEIITHTLPADFGGKH